MLYHAPHFPLTSPRCEPLRGKVGVQAVVASPVDSSGAPLGLPPIHDHHVHLTPGNAGDLRSETLMDCFLHGQRCLQGAVRTQRLIMYIIYRRGLV